MRMLKRNRKSEVLRIKKMKKYKDSKCHNCGKSCWRSSYVCGLCYVKVFKNNRNNCFDNWTFNNKIADVMDKDYLMCPRCHVNKPHCECVLSTQEVSK
jgi:hypothetical protein